MTGMATAPVPQGNRDDPRDASVGTVNIFFEKPTEISAKCTQHYPTLPNMTRHYPKYTQFIFQ
jgi:hypothetical protein